MAVGVGERDAADRAPVWLPGEAKGSKGLGIAAPRDEVAGAAGGGEPKADTKAPLTGLNIPLCGCDCCGRGMAGGAAAGACGKENGAAAGAGGAPKADWMAGCAGVAAVGAVPAPPNGDDAGAAADPGIDADAGGEPNAVPNAGWGCWPSPEKSGREAGVLKGEGAAAAGAWAGAGLWPCAGASACWAKGFGFCSAPNFIPEPKADSTPPEAAAPAGGSAVKNEVPDAGTCAWPAGSTRPTCPAGAPGWITNDPEPPAAAPRLAAGCRAGFGVENAPSGALGVAGAEPVKAWKTSFCGSLICTPRFAPESVLRKPTSEMPSISIPSSTTTTPLEICSFSVLAGTWEVIHAGTIAGLKPRSSALKPCSTAAKPSFA